MGIDCRKCKFESISLYAWPCNMCRYGSGDGTTNYYTPNTEEAKRALNYIYGKPSMDVASMYPKKLEKPIYIGTGPALPINNEIVEYLKNDVEVSMSVGELYRLERDANKIGCRVVAESWFKSVNMPGIEKVIFSGPCTIVLWDDNTKTVVRAQGDDVFDPEKGLAMAISKKALGNKGNYFDEFKKWLPEEEKEKEPTVIQKVVEEMKDPMWDLTIAPCENWKDALIRYLQSIEKE